MGVWTNKNDPWVSEQIRMTHGCLDDGNSFISIFGWLILLKCYSQYVYLLEPRWERGGVYAGKTCRKGRPCNGEITSRGLDTVCWWNPNTGPKTGKAN